MPPVSCRDPEDREEEHIFHQLLYLNFCLTAAFSQRTEEKKANTRTMQYIILCQWNILLYETALKTNKAFKYTYPGRPVSESYSSTCIYICKPPAVSSFHKSLNISLRRLLSQFISRRPSSSKSSIQTRSYGVPTTQRIVEPTAQEISDD